MGGVITRQTLLGLVQNEENPAGCPDWVWVRIGIFRFLLIVVTALTPDDYMVGTITGVGYD